MSKVLDRKQLSAAAQKCLDEFFTANDEYKEFLDAVRAEHPELLEALASLTSRRNFAIDQAKRSLKESFEVLAAGDPNLGEAHVGEFTLTPKRQSSWDVSKFLEIAQQHNLYGQMLDDRIILRIEDATFDMEKARALGVVEDLVAKGVLAVTANHVVDGNAAQDKLDSDTFNLLRREAWKVRLLNISCQTPRQTSIV